MKANAQSDVPVSGSGFPRCPDEITVDWLNGVMREAGVFSGDSIASVDTFPTGSGFGVISNTARLQLHYSFTPHGAPRSLFVKSSFSEPAERIRMHGVGFYEREVHFYRDVAPLVRLRVPRCYFAAIEQDTGHSLVVLEDPSAVRPGDDLAGYSTPEVESLFRQISAYHAQWWESSQLSEWTFLRAFDGDPTPYIERYRRNWPRFTQRFGESISPSLIAIGEKALSKAADLRAALAASPATLAHGDFRADNVLYGAPLGPAVVVDWQTTTRVSCAMDIARFLIISLPVSRRREDESRLVGSYHAALVEAGVADYSLGAFYRDLGLASLNNFFLLLGASLADRPGKRRERLVAAMIERNHAMLEDHEVWQELP